ncbi:hypothetical protein CCP3SC1AL1_1590007 [Gammaproteobacteria bacterium]
MKHLKILQIINLLCRKFKFINGVLLRERALDTINKYLLIIKNIILFSNFII